MRLDGWEAAEDNEGEGLKEQMAILAMLLLRLNLDSNGGGWGIEAIRLLIRCFVFRRRRGEDDGQEEEEEEEEESS